jgi:hypothetical protein
LAGKNDPHINGFLPSVFFARPGEKDRQKKKSTMLPQAKAVFV